MGSTLVGSLYWIELQVVGHDPNSQRHIEREKSFTRLTVPINLKEKVLALVMTMGHPGVV